MKKGTIVLISVIAAVLIIVMWAVSSYNGMVKMDETVNNSWSDVQALYQRRMDLIPNLVSTVQGYANFEKSTLTDVINARAKATQVTIDPSHMTQQDLQNFEAAQGQLSSSLSRLLVTVERYPDLKADQNFMALQAQLEGTENRISYGRQRFNATVKDYNYYVRHFPRVILAGMFGFQTKPYFQADQGASKAPQVKF